MHSQYAGLGFEATLVVSKAKAPSCFVRWITSSNDCSTKRVSFRAGIKIVTVQQR